MNIMKYWIIILFCIAFFACRQNNETATSESSVSLPDSTFPNMYDIKKGIQKKNQPLPTNKIPSSNINLSAIPVFKGKVARKEDVTTGKAIFYLEPNKKKHVTAKIKLPIYTYFKNDTLHITTIIVQAEVLGRDTILGYMTAKGKSGMCSPSDIIIR